MGALRSLVILWFMSAHAALAQEPYQLQPGDAIELWVAQEEQLNRQVSIGPDGRLSLPLVGQVEAQGMTIEGLGKVFKQRLQPYYSEDLDITVMLQPNAIHARSVFVAGDVSNPGVYPYRPNMTALHAVSVAGGFYRATVAAVDQDRSTMLRGEIARTQNRVIQMGATIARLQAELSNLTTINGEHESLAGISADKLKDALAPEQAILDMRIAELRIKESAEKQLMDIAMRNLDAAKERLRSVDTRINLATQRLANANKLIAQGFSQASQRLELESTIASMEGERSQLLADVATQEAVIVNFDAGMEAFLQERKTALLSAYNGAVREREALVSTLDDSIKALAVYDDVPSSAESTVIMYNVLRTKDGKTEEISGTEQTLIEPGDLIRVIKVQAASVAGDQ